MPYTLTLEDLHDAWNNRSKDVYSFLVLDRAKIGIAFNSLWLVWSAENADYPDPICCEIGIARNAFQIGFSAPFKSESLFARGVGALHNITVLSLDRLLLELKA